MPLTGSDGARQRPVVSLLTDFGSSEPFVGLVKARVLGACPDANIVDLTHELPPFSVEAAAFWIDRTFEYFPEGSVHVCVVDPGVGTARRILLVQHAGQCFLAPDNGLLAGIAGREGATVRGVDTTCLGGAGLGKPSATFHGRDLFAPLAGRLAAGTLRPEEMGQPLEDWMRLERRPAEVTPTLARGRVLFADNFGNLISNIDAIPTNEYKDWEVRAGGRMLPWVRTYGDAAPGSLVVLENSFGVLEIACVGGSAARVLGSDVGTLIEMRRIEPPG